MTQDEIYIKRCFDLARKGLGNVAPNPMVGAVIVYEDKIIGEGYHQKYGQAHAEVNAVKSAIGYHHLLSKSTLYVSLEPCCFKGKTSACTQLILHHKIPKVVISALDSTPEVNGKGVGILRNAGVQVLHGILKKEGEALAKARSVFIQKKRPYVILKFAKSLDGYFGKNQEQVWISNAYSKRLVHKWRSETDAIMVGTNTAVVDDPALTNRYFYGKSPVRVVLDKEGRLSSKLKLMDGSVLTYIASKNKNAYLSNSNLHTFQHPFDNQLLPDLLHYLHQHNIGNLIVEGGKKLLESFLDHNLWDEARVLVGKHMLHDGIVAPKLPFSPQIYKQIVDDKLYVYHNNFI